MSFNQNSGTAVPTLINSSAVLVTGNAVSSNALTVRQFGTGNVFSAQTTTGSTALFVGANGNVGVGTTSPQTALQVSGPATTSTNAGTPYANSFVSVTNDIAYGTTAQVGLEIGSRTRASGDQDRVYKYVFNAINNSTVGSGVDLQILAIPTATSSYASDGTARNRVTIRYDGNVGIGTTSPGYLLDLGYGDIRVQNGGNVGGAGGAINFGANAGCGPMAQIKGALETAAGSVNDQGSVVFLTRPQEVSPYTVRTNLTERMRITSGGNVGIGTTSSGGGGQPKLWSANDVTLVAGNYAGDVNAQIMAVGTTNPLKRLALMYDTTNNIGLVQAMIAGTGTSPLCLNAAGGNVGIGTASPGYLLDVSSFGVDGGTIRIASSSSCQFRMMEANDSYGFSFTNVAASRLSIKRHSASVGGTEVISILRDTGLVGIGTVSPGTILDVYTADSTYGMRHTTGTVSMASFISSGSSAAPAQFGTTTNHKLGFFTNNGTPNVVIDTSGRLGIGTGSPATTLDVRGPAPAMSLAAGYYFQNNTPSLVSAGAGSYGVQAYFSSTVAGGAFQAFSDRRIKKDIVDVHDAVSTINKIRPVSYHYIDELEKGAGVAYGFIAQEVEQVLPDSTKKLNEFVPNIFRVADSITGNTISVVDHGLTVGSQVKFISKDVGWWESNVVSVDDENTFTVEKDKIDDADLFVYGEKVKDYRTLDYEHVFSVGIAAIQELSAENTALKARLDSLEQRLAAAGL